MLVLVPDIIQVDDFNVRLLMPVLVKFVKEEAQTNRARKIAFQCIFDMVEADKAGALEFAAEVLLIVIHSTTSTLRALISLYSMWTVAAGRWFVNTVHLSHLTPALPSYS